MRFMQGPDKEPDGVRGPSIPWLDAQPQSSPSVSRRAVLRTVSFVAGACILARLLILYLVVPIAFLLALILAVLALRLHPVAGGLVFVAGIGFGIGFYFDHVVR